MEIRIRENAEGKEEIIIPINHNIGILRQEDGKHLTMRFGCETLKEMMLENMVALTTRNYDSCEIQDLYEEYNEETIDEEDLQKVVNTINHMEYKAKSQKRKDLELFLEQYLTFNNLLEMGISLYPIIKKLDGSLDGFKEEVQIEEENQRTIRINKNNMAILVENDVVIAFDDDLENSLGEAELDMNDFVKMSFKQKAEFVMESMVDIQIYNTPEETSDYIATLNINDYEIIAVEKTAATNEI